MQLMCGGKNDSILLQSFLLNLTVKKFKIDEHLDSYKRKISLLIV